MWRLEEASYSLSDDVGEAESDPVELDPDDLVASELDFTDATEDRTRDELDGDIG
jgi:hypothetical protein